MEHATAWRHPRRLYRNHFVAGPDHDDWSTLQVLCHRGLMRARPLPSDVFGDSVVFFVTELGLAALKGRDDADR